MHLPRYLFLRLLGLTHLIAFLSFWVQADGLVGPDGIVPAVDSLAAVAKRAEGWARIQQAPTLTWLLGAEHGLDLLCGLGCALSLLLIGGFAPRLLCVGLWCAYLSVYTLGGPFLSFQWDILLLEVTLLAILYAPDGLYPRIDEERPPTLTSVWLLRLLWFKLMLSAGVVKITSGDPSWADLSALDYHYWTQPLPHGLAWYAHNAPEWTRQLGVSLTFVGELVVPFLLFFNPRGRRLALWLGLVVADLIYCQGQLALADVLFLVAAAAFLDDRVVGRWWPADTTPVHSRCAAFWVTLLLMSGIALTGNYGFFHLLTVVLALSLLDDEALRRLVPGRWRDWLPEPPGFRPLWPVRIMVWAAALVILPLSAMRASNMVGRRSVQAAKQAVEKDEATRPQALLVGLQSLHEVQQTLRPFATIYNYGLFATMTKDRIEILVEGSADGRSWKPYVFRWKPGDLASVGSIAGPHMPRLDWQMWFAALRPDCRKVWWFPGFLRGLLEGSAPVTGLLAKDPFAETPPKYVRARRLRYRFTDPETRAESGHRWSRRHVGAFCPVLSLDAFRRP